jgi:hypothetical protein
MRVFSVPAKYRAFVEAQIALTLAEVKRDIDRRDDDHPGVRALATVHNTFINNNQKGTLTILVGANDSEQTAALTQAAGATT